MALSYTQLSTPITRDAALADILDMLDDVGFKATAWQEGAVGYTLAYIGAHVYAKLTEYVAFMVGMGFNSTAVGDALTRLAASHYDNTRQAAVETQLRVTFTTASGEGPHSVDVGDMVVTDGEHTYRNVEGLGISYPVNLTDAADVTLLCESEVAGADANVGDDTVTTLVTTYSGVTCTNDADPATGTSIVTTGADAETDDELQTRNATKWATLAVETVKDGTVNVALNSSTGIAKVAVDDSNPRGAGTADVYIAGLAAVAGASDVTACQTALTAHFFGNSTVPYRVQAIAATALTLDITGTVYYDPAFTAGDVQAAVEAALLAYVEATPIGGYDYSPGPQNVVRVNDLENVIKEAAIGGQYPVATVTLTVPAADVSVGAYQVVVPPASYSLTYTALST